MNFVGPLLCVDRRGGGAAPPRCCAACPAPACLQRRRPPRSAHVRRTCLPQKDADHAGRAREADDNAAAYGAVWRDPRDVLPPVCDAVPPAERGPAPALAASLFARRRRAAAGGGGDAGWGSFADIDRAYNAWQCALPPLSQRWADDAEFGRQRLCGLSPTELRVVGGAAPAHLLAALRGDQVAGLLDGHGSLDAAVAAGRVYVVDLSARLDGVPCRDGWHLCAPTLLLYFTDEKELLPIAIQLHPPGSAAAPDAGVVYTPNDAVYSWTLAKLHYQSAELHWLFFASKAHDVHAVAAFVASATYRTLSVRHPVRQAVAPFLAGAVAAHRYICETLLAPAGPVDDLFACGADGAAVIAQRARAAYSFLDAAFVHDVRRRRLDRERELRYPYLEDGVLVWEAIERYARGVVARFYNEPADLTNDGELNAWVSDIKRHLPSVPYLKEYTTDPLVFTIANVIWLCTARHSAWRGDLYAELGYVLNRPFRLRPPPPKAKDAVTEQDVLASLPGRDATLRQIRFVQQMASGWVALPKLLGTEDGRPMDAPHVAFADDGAQELYSRFVQDMVKVEEVIQLRNSERPHPYIALLPSEASSTLCL